MRALVVALALLLAGCSTPPKHADRACLGFLFAPPKIGLPLTLLCPYWADLWEDETDDLDV